MSIIMKYQPPCYKQYGISIMHHNISVQLILLLQLLFLYHNSVYCIYCIILVFLNQVLNK